MSQTREALTDAEIAELSRLFMAPAIIGLLALLPLKMRNLGMAADMEAVMKPRLRQMLDATNRELQQRRALVPAEACPTCAIHERAIDGLKLNLQSVVKNCREHHGWQPEGRALVPAPDAQAGWQPIETAPSGNELVLYFPEQLGRNAHTSMARVDFHPVHYPRKPTHWMPLPAPPVACEPGEGETR